jgi:polyisoprenoid-binding protein YceI
MPRNRIALLACLALGIVAAVASSALATSIAEDMIQLDPANTVVAFELDGNLHKTHGTFALKSGTISVDPATGKAGGEIVIDAASSSTQNGMRDTEMHNHVLESDRYPEITFVPATIRATRGAGGEMQGTITGVLNIHGAPHDMELDVHGSLIGDVLKGEARFVIPYAAWGMTNPSWLMFRVAGEVNVDVSTTAHVSWASADKSVRDQLTIGAPPH